MKCKKVISLFLVMTLSTSLLLAGCGGAAEETVSETEEVAEETASEEDEEEADSKEAEAEKEETSAESEEKGSDDELAVSLMQKYSAGTGNYSGETVHVKRDESIQMELGYNANNSDMSIFDSFVVYQDADLTYPVDIFDIEFDAESGILTIAPPYYGIGEMSSSEIELGHLSGNYLNDHEGNAWGTLSQYYLATYVDVATGEALEVPSVTVIKVDAELSAPQMNFEPTEDGYARFTWKEVEGADGYLLFKINRDETGYWEYNSVYADVTGNEWCAKDEEFVSDYDDTVLSINYRFQQYFIDDDSMAWMEENAAELLEGDDDIAYDEYWGEYYGMIAYNSEGASSMSNLMSAADLAKMLPTERAIHANEETFFDVHGVQNLPAVMNVVMCDGSTAQKVIAYDFDSVVKEEDNNLLIVKARGLQTPFVEEIHVYDVNWDALDADMEAVTERQEKLQNKGGNVMPSLTVDEEVQTPETEEEPAKEEEPVKEEEPAKEEAEETPAKEAEKEKPEVTEDDGIKEVEITVTANSAMSEYIALQMMETENAIDISAFPESADTNLIVDAFFEAQYQNPIVLGVQGGSIDTENRILYVDYDFDKKTTSEKQDEIARKVEEIVAEIITDDMSDAEKNLAINTYLCENAVYDNDALENAEKYSFTQVDEDFYDSFTAYGILVDGVGVCASYSASYKLLADAAGLDCVVVTGYLDGSVPHAWNKVNLDGEWYIVDSTNNDNDVIENALLNLSDYAAGSTLVEDERFALDDKLFTYSAGEEEHEYYHVTERFFDKEEIAAKLAELLIADGEAMLRTEYDIDDETFYEIAQDAANQAGKNINGFYWMGVINLQE